MSDAIDPNKVQWDAPPIDPRAVQWDNPHPKDVEFAKILRAALQDQVDQMPWTEKFFAGMGKSLTDQGLGLQQVAAQVLPTKQNLTSLVTGKDRYRQLQDEFAAKDKLDEPLMNTGGGLTGNVAGHLMTLIGPAAAVGAAGKAANIPRLIDAGRALLAPKTLPGIAAQGATMGAIQPTKPGENRSSNAAEGALVASALPVALQGANIVSTITAPFRPGGRQALAGRALERFATDPANITKPPVELVPGSLPTLAETAQDPGISGLYRTLANHPDANGNFALRAEANNKARVDALRGIAGDPGQRDYFAADRRTVADQLYGKALDEVPDATPWVKGQISNLQKRPAFQQAYKQAEQLALNEGRKLDPENATAITHYTKLALDDMISEATAAGQNQKAQAYIGIRDKLVSLIESKDFAPSYRQARDTYAQMSRPINQMDVGQALLDKFSPALNDFGYSSRATPNAFAGAVRSGDDFAARVLGFPGAKMDRVLTPDQIATVNAVGQDAARAAAALEKGKVVGSNTMQNIVGHDILTQVLGPLGMPKSFAGSVLAEQLSKPITMFNKSGNEKVVGLLSDAMLDPELAKQLYLRALTGGRMKTLGGALPYASPVTLAGLLSAQ